MQQLSPDLLSLTCTHLDSLMQLCNLGRACKSTRKFLASPSSDTTWKHMVKEICGYDVVDGPQSIQYRAMVTVCPYLSKPEVYEVDCKRFKKFEIAKRKSDGAAVLWCEPEFGDDVFHIHLSGRRVELGKEDLIFQENPRMPVTRRNKLEHFIGFGVEQTDRFASSNPNPSWLEFMNSGTNGMLIHKNLFVACSSIREHTNLIFYTVKNGEERVLYTIPAFIDVTCRTSRVDFTNGCARMCVRTGMHEVTYYGPAKRSSLKLKEDPAIIIRKIIQYGQVHGIGRNFITISNVPQIDPITGWSVLRCALYCRNREVCKNMVDTAEKKKLGIRALFQSSYDLSCSSMFTAVEAEDPYVVRFIMKTEPSGVNFISHNNCSVLTLALNSPETLETILNHHSGKIKILRSIWIQFKSQVIFLCEPTLHVLKKKIDFDPQAMQSLMETAISKNSLSGDPGLLVMNARFLRTLIIEAGDHFNDESKKKLLDFTFEKQHSMNHSIYNHYTYMLIFIASMGVKLTEIHKARIQRMSETYRSPLIFALDRVGGW